MIVKHYQLCPLGQNGGVALWTSSEWARLLSTASLHPGIESLLVVLSTKSLHHFALYRVIDASSNRHFTKQEPQRTFILNRNDCIDELKLFGQKGRFGSSLVGNRRRKSLDSPAWSPASPSSDESGDPPWEWDGEPGWSMVAKSEAGLLGGAVRI